MKTPIKIGLVDDHVLFRKGLKELIESLNSSYTIVFEAKDGLDLKVQIKTEDLPHIVLMDVSMPKIDGFESVVWLQEQFPNVKVLVVSMIEKEEVIVRMLKLGVKGYLCKDVEPSELKAAIESILARDYYYTDFVTGKLVHSLKTESKNKEIILNDREQEFLKLAATEKTYKEIADVMCLSPRTIDGYRESLFAKLEAKMRVGLVLYAIRVGLVEV